MSEFGGDVTAESTDTAEYGEDIVDAGVWGDADDSLTDENADIPSQTDVADSWQSAEIDVAQEAAYAQQAADYARDCGYERAADYIERHYAGEEFVLGEPIPVSTRNMTLEGSVAENGVPFSRRTVQLAEGLSVEGVFPEFDSRHHVELGSAANDMTLYQQFGACREDFQDHMFDAPEKLDGITIGDMERMTQPQGFTPEGYTWQHNPETGSFDLVLKKDHAVGHTGGNALWGVT